MLGSNCIVGRGAYVGTGVVMGDNCKLQNYALVYEPARLGHGVFVGPAVCFTNDHFPRSVTPDGQLKRGDDWEAVGVTCLDGASIGARSVCCLLYTSDAADERSSVDLGGRRIIKKKSQIKTEEFTSGLPHRLRTHTQESLQFLWEPSIIKEPENGR